MNNGGLIIAGVIGYLFFKALAIGDRPNSTIMSKPPTVAPTAPTMPSGGGIIDGLLPVNTLQGQWPQPPMTAYQPNTASPFDTPFFTDPNWGRTSYRDQYPVAPGVIDATQVDDE